MTSGPGRRGQPPMQSGICFTSLGVNNFADPFIKCARSVMVVMKGSLIAELTV